MALQHRTALRTAAALNALLITFGCARPPAAPVTTPVPDGLDSAATERWVASERRACRGSLAITRDEGAIRSDSTQAFRYVQRVTAVRCTPRP